MYLCMYMYVHVCICMTCMCRYTIITEWTYSWHIPYGSVVCPGPGDREKVLADSAHILSIYTTWKMLNRWVPEYRTQQDSGTASCCTLWTWIAIGNWCTCRHSSPPPGCRVVLYTLTLFIDDCKDYAFFTSVPTGMPAINPWNLIPLVSFMLLCDVTSGCTLL